MEYISPKEAAALLNVHKKTFLSWLRAGKFGNIFIKPTQRKVLINKQLLELELKRREAKGR